MKLDLGKMDVGAPAFNYVRTVSLASSGGADVSECLAAAARIRDNDDQSWIREWAIAAEGAALLAERAMLAGQSISARQAYLRASNYYRAAMSLVPCTDAVLDAYITASRRHFAKAATLFSPRIEVVEIPFREARLPGYFLSTGKGRRPTLIALNGADSSNEELIHWIGFAAIARGWNCFVFEGPGQWNALQMNPGLFLRPDYEVPVKAVVDYLTERDDVETEKIALIGYSLGASLAARVAAFETRICAYILDGLVVDVNEAWTATMPSLLRNAPPAVFDEIFTVAEKMSPELRMLANHFRWMLGVSKLHEIFGAWPAFSVKDLAPKMQHRLLLLYGEAEYQETSDAVALGIAQYLAELTCPVTIHEFDYSQGWAASHCQVGNVRAAHTVVFDWLERTVNRNECTTAPHTWDLLNRYHGSSKMANLQKNIRISTVG
jgi:pimeloyl-ACP methyl ester carboxylesterase